MRVVLWNLAWLLIGPATVAAAVFGTEAAYRASVPEPQLESFGGGEAGFAAWEQALNNWSDSRESLVMQVLIGTAILDVIAYFVVRSLLAARDHAKKSQRASMQAEPGAAADGGGM